jgi:hypothetical protein
MKLKLMMLLFAAVMSGAVTAQKNKKRANPAAAAATEDKGWKPTKGDTRNPFDTTKTKVTKNNLGAGDDPFGKKGKAGAKGKTVAVKQKPANGMEAEDTDEYKANGNPKKIKKAGKQNAPAPDKLIDGDDPFVKQANGLGGGEDPFGKTTKGKNRKKAATQDGYISDSLKTKKGKQAKAAGYANQDVNYMQQPATDNQATEANEEAATSTPKQPSGIDNSPSSAYVRFELEDIIEYNKKTMTKYLADNETGWYKRVAVQPQGITNVKVNYVKLYKTDGTYTTIQINQTVNAGVSTTVFETGLIKETKNHKVTIEKINKVGVSYEVLTPDQNKKGTAIHVNLFK